MTAHHDRAGIAELLARSDELLRRERWDEQMDLLNASLAVFPREPEFLYRYAVGCAQSDTDASAEYTRRAVALAGDDPAMLARAADLMYDIHDYEASERYLRRALPLAPEEFPLIPDMLHLAGKLALQKGNDPVAEEYLRHAFEIEPGSMGFGLVLAVLLARRCNFQESLEVINHALAHDPPDADRLLELRNEVSAEL